MTLRTFLFILLLAFPLALHAALPLQEVISDKGITAWLQEDQSLPVVSIAFAFKGGFESDADDKQGLSMLATTMLTHGAGAYDDEAFQRALQGSSTSIDFDARRDMITGKMQALKETLPEAVKLLQASVNAPRFEASILAREKNRQISTLKFRLADSSWLLLRLAMRETFAGHPYAKRAYGTEASILAVTEGDLKGWMKKLARENLLVTATGAITADELKKILDQVFGSLPEKASPLSIPEVEWKTGGKTFLLTQPGPQAQLLMVWPGLKRQDKDWYTLEVLDYILGGGSFSSRLMKEIREKRGLTYGINSGPSPLEHAALYTVEASFQGKNAPEVLRLTNEEIAKLTAAPVGADELQAAKDYLIGSYPLSLTSTSSIAAHYLGLRIDGLPMNEEEKRTSAIRAVTPEQVQALAKRLFASQPAVFFVGSPEGITPSQRFDKID